jgi:hypothetical protein
MRYPLTLAKFLAPATLLILIAIAYREAPNNVFHLDDGYNIVRHQPVMMTQLTAGTLIDAGRSAYLSTRPLPSMTFAIDWWRGGGSPRHFQWTNLMIHSAAAIAVFGLLTVILRRLNQPPWIVGVAALFGAALWACHPIQVQGVTYVVQRMASMAALFHCRALCRAARIQVAVIRFGRVLLDAGHALQGDGGDSAVPGAVGRVRRSAPWRDDASQ